MSSRLRLVLAGFLGTMLLSGFASAAPITFRATGEIASMDDRQPVICPPDLGYECLQPRFDGLVSVGMSLQLDVTFDPDLATKSSSSGGFFYDGAILGARLELGDFVYTRAGDEQDPYFNTFITTNYFLPAGVPKAGTGVVQFHFLGGPGWTALNGGPSLNPGLLVLGWTDLNALDGSLPTTLNQYDSGNAGYPLTMLLWQEKPDSPGPNFFTHDVTMSVVPTPVPEPSTLFLVAAGLLALGRRHRRNRDR